MQDVSEKIEEFQLTSAINASAGYYHELDAESQMKHTMTAS